MSTLFAKNFKKISRIDNSPTRDIIVEKKKGHSQHVHFHVRTKTQQQTHAQKWQ